jgi:hypothetical protein
VVYSPPSLNLTCNVFTGTATNFPVAPAAFTAAPRRASLPCALTFPPQPIMCDIPISGTFPWCFFFSMLLVAKHVDLRSFATTGGVPDGIECPAGSGRYYSVGGIEDRGKGYSNEHRVALILPLFGAWPIPIP